MSLTSRRSQPPLALAVPLSRFTPRVGGGSAFFVRPLTLYDKARLDMGCDSGLRHLPAGAGSHCDSERD